MSDETKKILIVDDEQIFRDSLASKFVSTGFEALTAKNGEEGLEVALENHPDLILLDILMPKVNGLEMLVNLREDQWGAEVPVIMLTNKEADDEILSQITSQNPSFYLIKADCSLEEIFDKVDEVLKESKA